MFNFKAAIVLLILLLSGNGILQAAPTLASVIKAEETDGKPPVLVDGGLLGALGEGMDQIQERLGLSARLLGSWSLRSELAVDEVGELVEQASAHPSWGALGDFVLLPAIWLGAFFGLMLAGRLPSWFSLSSQVLLPATVTVSGVMLLVTS